MPASPAETATPRPWRVINGDVIYGPTRSLGVNATGRDKVAVLWGADADTEKANAALIVEAVNAYDQRHVHCGCDLVHKPGQQLADLLRAATEFVDCDAIDTIASTAVWRHLDALRAAVRALQGPPAPFRPQQAHAAPATTEEAQ